MLRKLLFTGLVIGFPLSANAISAEFMEGKFEPVMNIPQVNSIEAWQQPRTQYTPKNLRSEYQIRYNGSDTNGRNAYSYTTHFTDYDTYITKSEMKNNQYYVTDNTGKQFVTGEHVDLTPINQSLMEGQKQIKNINQGMTQIQGGMKDLKDGMYKLKDGLYDLNDRMGRGLATVSALTSLHPNPRSQEKLEVSLGAGMWRDNFAGAVGLFYHPNDRVQLALGGSYGGGDSFAANAGITFSIGRADKSKITKVKKIKTNNKQKKVRNKK